MVRVSKKKSSIKSSKMMMNMQAIKFKQNVEHEINVQKASSDSDQKIGARYECIYKNLLREIRQYYSLQFEEFIK